MASAIWNKLMVNSSSRRQTDPSEVVIDLITCFIATNGVWLEKGYEIAKAMQEDLMVTIDRKSSLVKCKKQEIYSWLISSSFPRGEYVARLVSTRIDRSIEQINSKGGAKFLISLHVASESDVRDMLSPLFGVGKFIDNYLTLNPRS